MPENQNPLHLPPSLIYLCQPYALYFRAPGQRAWRISTFMRSQGRNRGLRSHSFLRFALLFWLMIAGLYYLGPIAEQLMGQLFCAIDTHLYKAVLRMVLNCLNYPLLQINIRSASG